MRVYYDLATEMLTALPGVNQPVAELVFKRTPSANLEVQFLRNSVVQELPLDATGIFGMKVIGQYDANYSVVSLAWTKVGTGQDTYYWFTFSFINTTMDAQFHVDGNVFNDVEQISLMAELQWISDDLKHKSQTFKVTIHNDVNRVGDGVPGIIPGSGIERLQEDFIATLDQTTYTLLHMPIGATMVFIDGLLQAKAEYSINTNQLIFTTPEGLYSGALVSIYYFY